MSIEKILESLARDIISAHNNNYGENIWNAEDYAKTQAKQAILSDLLELIEDEAVRVPANDMAIAIIRNLLRQELRDKVKEYCK